jgi:hypothetical protein
MTRDTVKANETNEVNPGDTRYTYVIRGMKMIEHVEPQAPRRRPGLCTAELGI